METRKASRSPPRPTHGSDAESSTARTPLKTFVKRHWIKSISGLLSERDADAQRAADDPLGECLTTILNQHPSFRYQPDTLEEDFKSPTRWDFFRYPPLISRHNLTVIWEIMLNWRGVVDHSQQTLWEKLENVLWFIFKDRKPMSTTIPFLFHTILILIPVMAAISHVILLSASRLAVTFFLYMFVMLFDWKELVCYPDTVRMVIERLHQVCLWIDAYILQGQRFKGREWNHDEYCWGDPNEAESKNKTLWELPPPSIRKGRRLCLSSHHLLLTSGHGDGHEQWSRPTGGHQVAVNFCYVMLREDNLRKQASRGKRMMEKAKASKELQQIVDDRDFEQSLTPRPGSPTDSGDAMNEDPNDYNDVASSVAVLLEEPRTSNARTTTPTTGHMEVEAIELRAMSLRQDCMGSNAQSALMLPKSPIISDYRSDASQSSIVSDVAGDLPWIDVGAKIGMRLLNSAHVQRAMASQETTDRLRGIGKFHDEMRGDGSSVVSGNFSSVVSASPGFDAGSRRSQGSVVGQASQLSIPVHSMWTCPNAAAPSSPTQSVFSDNDESSPTVQRDTAPFRPGFSAQPPLSPGRRGLLPPDTSYIDVSRLSPSNASSVTNSSVGVPCIEDQLDPPALNRLGFTDNARSTMVTSPAGRRIWKRAGQRSGHPSRLLSQSKDLDVGRKQGFKRKPLQPGVKVAVPISPIQPRRKGFPKRVQTPLTMGTVVKSSRIFVGNDENGAVKGDTNCLSVTVKLDKSFLRNAEFAELTFRVMDDWSSRYMPKHSKVPLGSCVATAFGIGVLAGWRVEDDCHVVCSLWQRRGNGSAQAFFNRDAIHSTVEAAVGFDVQTKYGSGVVLACVDGGKTFETGRFFVAIKEDGLHHGHVLELNRTDINSCYGAQFIPVIEHIREGAHYQIQVDNYEAALREQQYDDSLEKDGERLWKFWSPLLQILWSSFLKAVEEDKDFDDGVNEFMTSIIDFLERLDQPETEADEEPVEKPSDEFVASDFEVECVAGGADQTECQEEAQEPGFWIVNDMFGGVFRPRNSEKCPASRDGDGLSPSTTDCSKEEEGKPSYYDRMFSLLRTLMKTVAIAKAESVDHPQFRLGLAVSSDFLLFLRTIVKVQQKNVSVHSLEVWTRALEEIVLTFGPIKERLQKIGEGIAQRMEKQGRKAKARVLKFVDTVLGDEKLLFAMEQGEWDQCISRVEIALVKSNIIQEESLFYYRKTGQFIYDHICASVTNAGGAATRNNEKLALLAQFLQSVASPRRSILKLFRRDDILELIERILVRVYCRKEAASRILTIHASNFHTFRHLRMLKDFSVAGRMWIPLLDAADEEFSWVVSQMPDKSKDFVSPLSSLFSLCVAQFHKINDGDLSKDWLDFLLEDDAVRIIQEIDMKLILSLEMFSRDIREMMVVLPYYPSFDDDILKLMDEVDLDAFLKEASEAIDDPEALAHFLREKATIAVERFLNYLPKMSIPVERRDLGDGWVLTCRSEDGSDLALSDVKIKRENLVCQILGGDTLFFPMFGDDDEADVISASSSVVSVPVGKSTDCVEESILDHIRGLLLQAQKNGCWKQGVGGVGQPPSDRYVAAVLQGLPVSSVLNCAIELWRNLEIDDDELLEIAIRDVSFQIKLQQQREEGVGTPFDDGDVGGGDAASRMSEASPGLIGMSISTTSSFEGKLTMKSTSSFDNARRRFNPRVDPTVLFLEMKNLTLHLDNFLFRIEKALRITVFDPVFEGRGMVSLQNVSIRLRVECAKERVKRTGVGAQVSAPILQIQELSVGLEKMQVKVKDTGFGSDWVLNRAVNVFADRITKVVKENLRDQILEQSRAAIENLNAYFLVNPTILLNLLGISLDDLEENVVYV